MANTDTLTERPAGVAPSPARARSRPSRRRDRIEIAGLVGALVLMVIVFTIASPGRFPTLANLQTILDQASVPLIIGVGATMVILLGSIDLSIEGVMGAAGMAFVLLIPNSRGGEDHFFFAVLAALAMGIALGLVTGLVHTRLKVPTFIVTLGIWYVGLGIATLLFGTDSIPTITSNAITDWPQDTFLSLPHSFLLAAAVIAVGVLITRYTRLGRFTYAIGDNEAIARDNGVHVSRYKVAVFVVAGLCSAVAGILASMQLGAGQATVGIGNLFLTIPAVVIGGTSLGGGRGGIVRTALGVLLLVTLNNGLIVAGVSANIRSGVAGLVLIVAVVGASWANRGRLAVAK